MVSGGTIPWAMRRILFTAALGNSPQWDGALGLGRSLKLVGDGTERGIASNVERLPHSFHRLLEWGDPDVVADRLLSEGYDQVAYAAPEYLVFGHVDALFGLGTEMDEGRVRTWGSGSRKGSEDRLLGIARTVRGRLRLNVTLNECRWVEGEGAGSADSAELKTPVLFRPASEPAWAAYRRQLKVLESLERYELSHGFGYVPPLMKLRRSIEKRILRLQNRL